MGVEIGISVLCRELKCDALARERKGERDIVLVRDHLPPHFSPPGSATARREEDISARSSRRRKRHFNSRTFRLAELAAEKWQFIIFISLSLCPPLLGGRCYTAASCIMSIYLFFSELCL